MAIATINPATGETLRTFPALTDAEIETKLQRAHDAFQKHKRTSMTERAECMMRAAEILEARGEEYGRLMTVEMGKPLKAAIEEVKKCAVACRFYAEHAARFLADEEIQTNATRSFIRYQPLGTVLAVMPWNFPFWQTIRFAAPALMAGNTGLLKHSSNVPQCALAIEDVFRDAGFVEGAFQTLLIGAGAVGQILEDERVKAVTLTGSEPAGSEVASRAGKMIKKTVLELGGSDPFIVMPTADLEEAVKTAVKARTINNGQSCIAAKRFIIHTDIYDEFASRFVENMSALKVGDPMNEATDIGPLATVQVIDDIERQVQEFVAAGARLLTGGERLPRPGNFYTPTVLENIPKNAPAYREETFGPVATLFRARDIGEAIEIANDTQFGLGASAWTNDVAEQRRFIEEIEAGQVFINSMVASDPRLPFGGVKHSGYGRELSALGIREFVNIKTVSIMNAATDSESSNQHRSDTE
jgi:succinate-semialdehyde dehydrogenase/glutarate-semialdehyde dehydrogenase